MVVAVVPKKSVGPNINDIEQCPGIVDFLVHVPALRVGRNKPIVRHRIARARLDPVLLIRPRGSDCVGAAADGPGLLDRGAVAQRAEHTHQHAVEQKCVCTRALGGSAFVLYSRDGRIGTRCAYQLREVEGTERGRGRGEGERGSAHQATGTASTFLPFKKFPGADKNCPEAHLPRVLDQMLLASNPQPVPAASLAWSSSTVHNLQTRDESANPVAVSIVLDPPARFVDQGSATNGICWGRDGRLHLEPTSVQRSTASGKVAVVAQAGKKPSNLEAPQMDRDLRRGGAFSANAPPPPPRTLFWRERATGGTVPEHIGDEDACPGFALNPNCDEIGAATRRLSRAALNCKRAGHRRQSFGGAPGGG